MTSRVPTRQRLLRLLLVLAGNGLLLTLTANGGCDPQIQSALITSVRTMTNTAVDLFFNDLESRGSFTPVTV